MARNVSAAGTTAARKLVPSTKTEHDVRGVASREVKLPIFVQETLWNERFRVRIAFRITRHSPGTVRAVNQRDALVRSPMHHPPDVCDDDCLGGDEVPVVLVIRKRGMGQAEDQGGVPAKELLDEGVEVGKGAAIRELR